MSPMDPFIMDLQKEGLLMFFKPWQLICLQTLWNSNEGLSSKEVWESVKDMISRASVINFLDEMTRNGLLIKDKMYGRGGFHGVYKAIYDEQRTREYIKCLFRKKLEQL